MGHQDVVPVPQVTETRWKYPPYSAEYDGRFIWGRGATDCKNVVIGVLEAFETLLEKGYKPERTMMAGFGFDEEISGWQGAAYIAKHLEDTRGKNSIDLIIDEGGLGIKEFFGAMFVMPGVGEKGKYSSQDLSNHSLTYLRLSRRPYYSRDGRRTLVCSTRSLGNWNLISDCLRHRSLSIQARPDSC